MAPQEAPRIVVGIDFGTTLSGVAWALEDSTDDIEVIQSWLGGGNATSQKVPSVLAYPPSGSRWGFQVNDVTEGIRGFNLLLDESQN